VRAAAHFIDGDLWSVEYGAHTNFAHELSGFLHAIGIQDDVLRDANRRTLILLASAQGLNVPRKIVQDGLPTLTLLLDAMRRLGIKGFADRYTISALSKFD
jgi:hypothetical protein